MAATVKTNVVVSIGAFVSVFHLFAADLFDVSPVL